MSKKARSLVFLGPSDGEKVLLCFKWGVLNYALECRLDGVQNHSRSRPYPCTRAFSDGIGWPSPLLHGREDFWVIIHFCCWVGILCVCFQVDIVLHTIQIYKYKNIQIFLEYCQKAEQFWKLNKRLQFNVFVLPSISSIRGTQSNIYKMKPCSQRKRDSEKNTEVKGKRHGGQWRMSTRWALPRML